MRVVGGKAGGIRLRAPRGRSVRPTIDRVKESVFAMLGPIEGLVVADLFSGTGALGLEALSRGAAEVLFTENDRKALAVLKKNLQHVNRAMGEHTAKVTILARSVQAVPGALPDWAERCDIILADPPYRPGKGTYGAHSLLRDPAFSAWAGMALLVLEHAHDQTLPWYPECKWAACRQKRYGTVMVSFARQRPCP